MKQKSKKVSALIVSLIMVISMIPLSMLAFAESKASTVKMRLDVPEEPVDCGQTIQVPVVVENMPLGGINFSVDYDDTILEFVSYTESVFSIDAVNGDKSGKIVVACMDSNMKPAGVIGVITFKVISDNIIAGTVSLDLSVYEALDENDNDVSGGFNASFSFEKAGYSITADENGNCAVTGYTGKATELAIPSEIDGYTVTSIGESAFAYCDSLVSVTIPDGVTSIGVSAFELCESLTSVTIPDSVTSIDDAAFAYCILLAKVTIPDSVTTIGNSSFVGCASFTNVTIPDSVTSIGNAAFAYCDSLTKVTIPDSVTCVDDFTFCGCTSLASVTIPNSVTYIGVSAFEGCSSLTSVTIPDSVTSIGINAFNGCTSLANVTIPDSVTSIDGGAFITCDSLTSVTIPKSVTTIGNQAFGYIYNVELSQMLKIDNFTVYGYSNTAAEEYANKNGFKFVSLDKHKPGDVNFDGQIAVEDARLILKSIVRTVSFNDMQKSAADINKDSRITVADAKWILQIVAGLRDETTLKLK